MTDLPAALRRRMKAGPTAETRPVQRVAVVGTIVSVVAELVISALDHRFGWSQVPTAVIIVGNVLVAVGLGLAQLVVIQNSYAAATITVEAEPRRRRLGVRGQRGRASLSSTAQSLFARVHSSRRLSDRPRRLQHGVGQVSDLPEAVVDLDS